MRQIPLYFEDGHVEVKTFSMNHYPYNYINYDIPLIVSTCISRDVKPNSNPIKHRILFRLESFAHYKDPTKEFFYI